MRLVYILCLLLSAAFLALGFAPAGMLARAVAPRLPEVAAFAESVTWGLKSAWSWLGGLLTGHPGLPECPAALYLIVINVIALLVMGLDKLKAKADAWREPERKLFLLALIGGSLGAWTGMYLFHHKTNAERKPHFVFGFPLIYFLHVALGALIWKFVL